jgi:hypothetical protein
MRTVKHLSLDRIGGTELRVVSDIEHGVFPILSAEQTVVERYTATGRWPHRRVTFYILQDLQPLISQLKLAGGVALASRPAACIYDLARLDDCFVFVNEQVMRRDGTWDDLLAAQGLLAHEHAHPIAENAAIRASRRLRADLAITGPARARAVLAPLIETITWGAPRELFTNQTAIEAGFGEALFHLDAAVMADAAKSVFNRAEMTGALENEVRAGAISPREAEAVALIGDFQAHLPLALETAPFRRAERDDDAARLEQILEQMVFPRVDRRVRPAYAALRDHYLTARPEMGAGDLIKWSSDGLKLLSAPLHETGVSVTFQFRVGEDRSGWIV